MGDKITLKLDVRTLHGKKTKSLRADGFVPGIIYGPGIDPISVQAPYQEVEKVYRHAGKHTPVELSVDSKKRIAMIKDVDLDPVRRDILHVSFHAVKADEPVVAEIPIHMVGVGESEAERAGLVVLQSLEKIEVRALPMVLPEALSVNIHNLKEPGDRVLIGDIALPEGVELVERKTGRADEDEEAMLITDLTIATVYEPSALQAANEAAGGDAEDESEVIGEADGEANDGDKSPEAGETGTKSSEPSSSDANSKPTEGK